MRELTITSSIIQHFHWIFLSQNQKQEPEEYHWVPEDMVMVWKHTQLKFRILVMDQIVYYNNKKILIPK